VKARPVRFAPDPLDHALLAFGDLGGPFVPTSIALIVDESPRHGCGLVLADRSELVDEALCVVQVGRMDPVAARVVWRKPLTLGLVQVGLQYLE